MKALRSVKKKLKLDFALTTKVARHTWTTIAKKQGYSKDMISEILGHRVPGSPVTDIYMGEFDQEVKDECIRRVADLVYHA